MIRVMVVDDEPLAREELQRLIAKHEGFDVVAQAENGKEALELLKKDPVDVLFCDIEMPGLTGLEVASLLSSWENPPALVFATAYHDYAVQAFDANAIDYILKPYDPDRLAKALERARDHVKSKAPSKEKLQNLEDYLVKKGVLKRLIGKRRKSKEKIMINPSEVCFFHAKLAEVWAHTDSEELLVSTTLKELMDRLDPSQFGQSHKAYVVNLDKVAKVAPMFSGNYEMTLKDSKQSKIPLSRRYAREMKKRIGDW